VEGRAMTHDGLERPLAWPGTFSGGGMKLILLVLGLLHLQVQDARAWGSEGHSIVAEIAQRNLSPAARARLAELLPNSASLASLSTWADDIRPIFDKSFNWHFVSIPLDQTNYDPDRDCLDTPRGDCVINAIDRFTKTLSDRSIDLDTRRDALKYLVHFVGDLHQPLHTVKDFLGGNRFDVRFFVDPRKKITEATDLHAVWDTGLIRASFWSWGGYVDFLEAKWLPGRDIQALTSGTPIDWVLDAHRIAIHVAFDVDENTTLGEDYLQTARPHLDRQLAIAGLRLARILNEALK
jgi:nuclease S1